MHLPLADPQFWIVTGAAAVALAYVLRKRLRLGRRGAPQLPCDNCPKAGEHGLGVEKK